MFPSQSEAFKEINKGDASINAFLSNDTYNKAIVDFIEKGSSENKAQSCKKDIIKGWLNLLKRKT